MKRNARIRFQGTEKERLSPIVDRPHIPSSPFKEKGTAPPAFSDKKPLSAKELEILVEEVNWLRSEHWRMQETLQQRDEGILWLRDELALKQQELSRIKGSLIWRVAAQVWRWLRPVRLIANALRHPLEWLALQRWYWQLRALLKSVLSKLLPTAAKNWMKIRPIFLSPAEFSASPAHTASDSQGAQSVTGYRALTLLPHLNTNQMAALPEAFEAATTRRPDVICFSIIDWDFRYQRPQQIMSQFAAHGHRVFYLSTTNSLPAKAVPRVAVREVQENVYEVLLAAQRLPDVYGEVIQGLNQQELLESLTELRRTFHIDAAIAYIMIASWGELALATSQRWGWQTIYDCMDEWENFPGVKPALLQMERRLVKECQQVVVTAKRLYLKWKNIRPDLVLARNAADVDFYDRHCRPNSLLGGVDKPIIGYFGAIAEWFDVALVEYLAKARPQYQIILLGGVFGVDVSGLRVLPNVKLLGQQPYETMPQYLYHFAACLIPFKINPITQATDPVKLYEYLSGGKPVIATAMQELEAYRDFVYLAHTYEEFAARLDQALAEDNATRAEQRRLFAQEHTWEKRYEAIYQGLVKTTPQASIIVVTWRNLALTQLCLESLLRNTEYANYEIIVVDNNSDDGTPDYLREMASRHAQIKILLNSANHGFAQANNQGIAISTGEFLVLLNNDTIVPPGWLSRLLAHLDDPAVGIVGPVTNAVGNEAKLAVSYHTWREMESFARAYTWQHDQQIADITMLAMFCLALRRTTYDLIGTLDEQFGIGMFEDDDYSLRVKNAGLRVVCAADVFVHHFGQAAFKQLIANGNYNPLFETNRRRYEEKWKTKWIPHKHAPLMLEPHRMERKKEAARVMHA